MKCFEVLPVLAAALCALPFSAGASAIVDFSPDATGVAVSNASITDSMGQFQIIGDQFTIATGLTITGGSIFATTQYDTLGEPVQFMIFSNPGSAPIISVSTTVDAVDSTGTTTQTSLHRVHSTIPSTFLAAGTYWFSMAGSTGDNFVVATGHYADNSIRSGSGTTLPSPVNGLGDLFFQVESTPEPATLSLLGVASLTLLGRRSRRCRPGIGC